MPSVTKHHDKRIIDVKVSKLTNILPAIFSAELYDSCDELSEGDVDSVVDISKRFSIK